MENKFRNEMEIKLGEETILLRPTFENIAATEQTVGSISWLGWKYSRGVTIKDGKVNVGDRAMSSLPPITESTRIIYLNQAATKPGDDTQKKLTLEEVWDLVQMEGSLKVGNLVVTYLSKLTAGNRAIDKTEAPTEAEKKS